MFNDCRFVLAYDGLQIKWNLANPITYIEAPMRTITSIRASWYASSYLRSVALAQGYQISGSWNPWTTAWWKEREMEALRALSSLRDALQVRENEKENSS